MLVFVLSSSYTANLSSVLTVQQRKPGMEQTRTDSKIGCDRGSFVRTYLEEVLHIKPENIVEVEDGFDYNEKFQTKQIDAAFLEIPYQKVFLNKHCDGYTAVSTEAHRFGGLGFVSDTKLRSLPNNLLYYCIKLCSLQLLFFNLMCAGIPKRVSNS